MDMKEVVAFEKPAVEVKPSEWLRIGMAYIPEVRGVFVRDGCGCAIGTIFIAKTGKRKFTDRREFTELAAIVGLPERVMDRVSDMHHQGASRKACASWLESQGL